jgi:predicted DNA-binding transcriptional regulator YafY
MTIHSFFSTTITRIGTPLGMVARGGSWHLVWKLPQRPPRAEPLDNVVTAHPVPDPIEDIDDFDLPGFWEHWMQRTAAQRRAVPVTLTASDDVRPLVESEAGWQESEAAGGGTWRIGLSFDTFSRARSTVLGWGGAVEVTAPEALRRSVADYAHQIGQRYRSDS